VVRCYLGLGSNVDDRIGMIARAVACLSCPGDVVVRRLSSMYETRPWGEERQRDFVNAVVEIDTHLSPKDLLARVKCIERDLGRRPGARWGPRSIDIDILFYGTRLVAEHDLMIPHPYICERAFVLAPLVEIAPDLVHPATGRSVRGYLEDIEDSGEISWRNLDS
jgi:2-amino-4-hydroxy-6-hydroxymethyldihydropteridine diphosphokinase